MRFFCARHPIFYLVLLVLAPGATFAQLAITAQPQGVVVAAGQRATLSVGATAATGNVTYQWRRNGYALPAATSAIFTVAAASQGDNDVYDVVVTAGGSNLTSVPARVFVTPSGYPGAVAVDPARSMALEGPTGGTLYAQSTLPDGRFYVAGTFTSANGNACSSLVRFTAAGTLDPTFVPPAFDQPPRSLAVQMDGKVVLVGPFTSVGGVPTSGIVRLNSDGTPDSSFVVGTGFSSPGFATVQVTPSGAVYVLGFAGSYQGTPVTGSILKLTSSGAIDASFTAPTYAIGNSSTNATLHAIDATGMIYVTGGFDRVNGVPRSRVARLLANGTVDPTFNPGTGPNNFVYVIVPLSTGQIVLSGDFTAYNGSAVGRIVRLNADGTIDPTFTTGVGFSGQVNQVVALPSNQLFVGTSAASFNGAPVRAGVRLNANGTLDGSFVWPFTYRPELLALLPNNRLLATSAVFDNSAVTTTRIIDAGGNATGPRVVWGFPGRARFFAPLPGGKILVAGDFTSVNGTPAPYIMRLNADLSRDPSYPNGPGPAAVVVTGAMQPDGKVVLLTINGAVRLNADGSTDATFNGSTAPAGYWYPFPPVVLPDGCIFVPTDCPYWGAAPVTNGFVVLQPNGARATSHFLLPGPPAGSYILGFHVLPNGQYLVTGSFSSWNGVARARAVRLNRDGSVDPAFTLDPGFATASLPSYVRGVKTAVQRDGRLLETSLRPPYVVARFGTDGARDVTYGGLLPPLFDSGQLLVQGDDRVIVYGQGEPNVSTPAALPAAFCRLNADGTADTSFALAGSQTWYGALITDGGELLSSDGSGRLHRYAAIAVPTFTQQPVGQSLTVGSSVTLQAAASGQQPVSYQWYKDGVALVGATAATLSFDAAPMTATGSYTVVAANIGGSTTSNAATLSISPRPLAGTYFGALGTAGGSFALYVRPDGSGVFLGYVPATKTALFSRNLAFSADRHFHFGVDPTPSNAAADVVADGNVSADGAINGTFFGLTLGISAPAPASSGSDGVAGFYQAGVARSSDVAYLIVSPTGNAFGLFLGAVNDSASGRVDANGSISLATSSGRTFTGVTSAATNGTWGGALLGTATAAPITYIGSNDDRRVNIEQLVNVSSRSVVDGTHTLTAGFVLAGSRPKTVLVRAIGPSLGGFGVANPASQLRLDVYRGSALVATNTAWTNASNAAQITAASSRVGAFPLATGAADAAALLTLDPGAYSAVVAATGSGSGVALLEVYDATEGAIPRTERVVNISTLAPAGSGDAVLTAGFVVNGTTLKRVLVRGIGPTLQSYGVAGALANPQIAVYSGDTIIARNAGWGTNADPGVIAAAAAQVGAFALPAGSQDAALILNLPPGGYSAQVSSTGGSSGPALIEVYELP